MPDPINPLPITVTFLIAIFIAGVEENDLTAESIEKDIFEDRKTNKNRKKIGPIVNLPKEEENEKTSDGRL